MCEKCLLSVGRQKQAEVSEADVGQTLGDKFICRQLEGTSETGAITEEESLLLDLFSARKLSEVGSHHLLSTHFACLLLHIVCLSDNVILPAYFHVMVQ